MSKDMNGEALPEFWNFPHGAAMRGMLSRFYIAQLHADALFHSCKPDHIARIVNGTAFVLEDSAGSMEVISARIAKFLRFHTPISTSEDINRALRDISTNALKTYDESKGGAV